MDIEQQASTAVEEEEACLESRLLQSEQRDRAWSLLTLLMDSIPRDRHSIGGVAGPGHDLLLCRQFKVAYRCISEMEFFI